MNACLTCEEQGVDYLLGELDPELRARFEEHLRESPACAEAASALEDVPALVLRRPDEEPPVDLLAGLKVEARKRAVALRADASGRLRALPRSESGRWPRREISLAARLLAAITRRIAIPVWVPAMVVLAVVLSLWSRSDLNRPAPPASAGRADETRAAPVTAPPDPGERFARVGETAPQPASPPVTTTAASPFGDLAGAKQVAKPDDEALRDGVSFASGGFAHDTEGEVSASRSEAKHSQQEAVAGGAAGGALPAQEAGTVYREGPPGGLAAGALAEQDADKVLRTGPPSGSAAKPALAPATAPPEVQAAALPPSVVVAGRQAAAAPAVPILPEAEPVIAALDAGQAGEALRRYVAWRSADRPGPLARRAAKSDAPRDVARLQESTHADAPRRSPELERASLLAVVAAARRGTSAQPASPDLLALLLRLGDEPDREVSVPALAGAAPLATLLGRHADAARALARLRELGAGDAAGNAPKESGAGPSGQR